MKTIYIILFLTFLFIPAIAGKTDGYTDTAGGINVRTDPVTLPNPLGSTDTPNEIIGQLINGVLGIVGSLALVMFIYGGFMWMMAAGSNERVQKGKDIIMWATIGLVVIFSAYAAVKFIMEGVTGATAPTARGGIVGRYL